MKEYNLAYYLMNPAQAHLIPESQFRTWEEAYPYSFGVKWLKARKDLNVNPQTAGDSIGDAARYTEDFTFLYYKLLEKEPIDYDVDSQLEEEDGIQKVGDRRRETRERKREKGDGRPEGTRNESEEAQEKEELLTKMEKDQKSVVPEAKPFVKAKKKKGAPKRRQKRKKLTESAKKLFEAESRKSQETPKQKSKREKTEEEIVIAALSKKKKEYSEFTQWLIGLEGKGRESRKGVLKKGKSASKVKKVKKAKKKAKKITKLEKLISQSIIEREEAVTETYADLIAAQGYSNKAIELYEKLMLKFPEKSSYFAAKIGKLVKK